MPELTYKCIRSRVNRVIYYHAYNKWGVLSVTNTINDRIFTEPSVILSGNFDGVYDNCEVEFDGKYFVHRQYGPQIEITRLKVLRDVSSEESIVNFLVKSEIAGISVQNARKIYATFGSESIDVVLNKPEELKVIYGIGDGTYEKVIESVNKYKRIQELLEYGLKLGIPYNLLYKLDLELGALALPALKDNIYKIVELCEVFSFKQLDTIGKKIGIAPNDPARLRACMIDRLRNKIILESSTGCTTSDLKISFMKSSGLSDIGYFTSALNILKREELVVLEGSYVYYKPYYNKEEFIARILKDLKQVPLSISAIPSEIMVESAVASFNFSLNKDQEFAIEHLVKERVGVLTGGPGTGKSTITKALVDALRANRVPFFLLSPTGKATRRLEECTGFKAQTIHKFLGVKHSLEEVKVPDIPKDSVLIIDESSMVDIIMLSKLIEVALKNPIRIVFVGDKDQLPSVQAGNVLGDLIASGVIPTYTLADIMRQSKDSNIIKYCDMINKGISINECNHNDFVYTIYQDENDLINDLLDNYEAEVNEHGLKNVQVISPYKEGVLGTKALNYELSNYVNQNNINETFNFRIGDKVMQTVNDYNKDIFNGETGVVEAFMNDTMKVRFNDRVLDYEPEEVSSLITAYASTCHKSQGAEYPVVFVILEDKYNGLLLTRKLLYTAVSRGKKKVYIYSIDKALDYCISNTYEVPRITKLKSFLKSC